MKNKQNVWMQEWDVRWYLKYTLLNSPLGQIKQ